MTIGSLIRSGPLTIQPCNNSIVRVRSIRPVLTELILLLDLPDSTKDAAKQLRELEKSVRNPLAHLIKPFDEEELHRTTGFSSQHFMELLVSLAQKTGIVYQREPFYFDQANAVIEALL